MASFLGLPPHVVAAEMRRWISTLTGTVLAGDDCAIEPSITVNAQQTCLAIMEQLRSIWFARCGEGAFPRRLAPRVLACSSHRLPLPVVSSSCTMSASLHVLSKNALVGA